jgi:hypothetical protein
MTRKLYPFLIASLILAVVGISISTSPRGVRAKEGGIKFSHTVHKAAAECSTCHPAAASTSLKEPLLPKPEVCSSCHEAKDVRGFWNLQESDPLDKDYLQSHAKKFIFNHKFHMDKFGSKCESCHFKDKESTEPEKASMFKCTVCHNNGTMISPMKPSTESTEKQYAVTAYCEACHTTLAGLIPENHENPLWSKFHGKYAMNSHYERLCQACHSMTFCQECHMPSNNVPATATKKDFYLEGDPRGEVMDDSRLLTVQSVHNLTYKYTHGFDARVQSSRCQTCHNPETFCTPCHRGGYDASGMRIVPQSHQLAGFVALGQPKAMNRHAKLAEMDLESCVTCHDVDGGDPVCAMCHSSGIVK